MKRLPLLLLACAWLFCLAARPALAAPAQHYAIAFSATIFSQVAETGSSGSSVAHAVNNATMLESLVLSGTAGVTRASDLDIVLTFGTLELDVINRTTHATVYVLGTMGGSYATPDSILTGTPSRLSLRAVSNDYIVTPVQSVPMQVNLLILGTLVPRTGAVISDVYEFQGGDYTGGKTLIQGLFRTTGRIYDY